MKSIIRSVFVIVVILAAASCYAVDGYGKFKFGMTIDEAKQAEPCEWKKIDTNFSGFMIHTNKHLELFRCDQFIYESREIEFYLEFFDNTLQRIILDISDNPENNQKTLELFKQRYGFANGQVLKKDRSSQLTFDDPSVEVEIYEPPLNLMYLRFYSENYQKLIKQPYLQGLTT